MRIIATPIDPQDVDRQGSAAGRGGRPRAGAHRGVGAFAGSEVDVAGPAPRAPMDPGPESCRAGAGPDRWARTGPVRRCASLSTPCFRPVCDRP